MDKTIELIMVVTVTIVVAGIIVFLVQGETGTFGDWVGGQQDNAECDLWQTKYKSQVEKCGGSTPKGEFTDQNPNPGDGNENLECPKPNC